MARKSPAGRSKKSAPSPTKGGASRKRSAGEADGKNGDGGADEERDGDGGKKGAANDDDGRVGKRARLGEKRDNSGVESEDGPKLDEAEPQPVPRTPSYAIKSLKYVPNFNLKTLYDEYVSCRLPCLVKGYDASGSGDSVAMCRYFMFHGFIAEFCGGEDKEVLSELMPCWWRDKSSLLRYTDVERYVGQGAGLDVVNVEVRSGDDDNFGNCSKADDIKATFGDYINNKMSHLTYLTTQSSDDHEAGNDSDKDKAECLKKLAGSDFADNYRYPPLSLLAVKQKFTEVGGGEGGACQVQAAEENLRVEHCKNAVKLLPLKLPLSSNLKLTESNLWLGCESSPSATSSSSSSSSPRLSGASSGLHYDYHDNFLLCLKGYKRIRIIKPEDAGRCYMAGDREGDFVEDEECGGGDLDEKKRKKYEDDTDEEEEEEEEDVTIGKGFDYKSSSDDEGADELRDDFDDAEDDDGNDSANVGSGEENSCDNSMLAEVGEPPSRTAEAEKRNLEDILPHFSLVDPNLPQSVLSRRYPKFVGVPQCVIDMSPGEVLYMPAYYLHEVKSYGYKPEDWKGDNNVRQPNDVEDGMHMAINWWYEAPVKGSTYVRPYKNDKAAKEKVKKNMNKNSGSNNSNNNSSKQQQQQQQQTSKQRISHQITQRDDKDLYRLKVLVPENMIGPLIGKQGKSINAIQQNSGADVKIGTGAPTPDGLCANFPNSKDRVCMVSGDLNCVKDAIAMIVDKFGDPENHSEGDASSQFKVCILIGQQWSPVIIGKKGCVINVIKTSTKTRCSIMNFGKGVSPQATYNEKAMEIKSADTAGNFQGQVKAVRDAIGMILDVIKKHKDICKYENIAVKVRADARVRESKKPFFFLTPAYTFPFPRIAFCYHVLIIHPATPL